MLGNHEAPEVSNRLGNSEPFFPKDPTLGERAPLGMAPDQVRTGPHSVQKNLAEALVASRISDGRHGLA